MCNFGYAIALLLLTTTVRAGTLEDHFGTGVLGLSWRASISEVAQKFPDGHIYPSNATGEYHFRYHVTADANILSLHSTNQEIDFYFDDQDRLRMVSLAFGFDRSAIVLRTATEALGEHSNMRSIYRHTTYSWQPDQRRTTGEPATTPQVKLVIGNAPPYEWVVLYVAGDLGWPY